MRSSVQSLPEAQAVDVKATRRLISNFPIIWFCIAVFGLVVTVAIVV